MNLLQQWLDGPQEYEAGRLLYEQHGRNHVLKRTLSHGPNAYNKSALREELAKLVKAAVVCHENVALMPVPAAPAVVEIVIATPAGAPAPVEQLPTATQLLLLDLDKQWKPLYKQASHLQGRLKYAKDVQERCTWSHQILDLMDQVQGIWDTGAYVKAHGQLPPVVEVVPPPALDLSDQAAVLKRRNNLRAQISKQKRNKDRADEVEAWKAEVEQLDNVLKTFELPK